MIIEMHGDVFNQGADIICHQVNCKGVMGAGIAVTVKKLIEPIAFEQYQFLCKERGATLLGEVFYTSVPEKDFIIANCFGQNGCGSGLQTDYAALKKCFENVLKFALEKNYTVAIPGLIGCGLAGGDWEYVKNDIIIPLFEKTNILLKIVYFEKDAYEKYATYK